AWRSAGRRQPAWSGGLLLGVLRAAAPARVVPRGAALLEPPLDPGQRVEQGGAQVRVALRADLAAPAAALEGHDLAEQGLARLDQIAPGVGVEGVVVAPLEVIRAARAERADREEHRDPAARARGGQAGQRDRQRLLALLARELLLGPEDALALP